MLFNDASDVKLRRGEWQGGAWAQGVRAVDVLAGAWTEASIDQHETLVAVIHTVDITLRAREQCIPRAR